MDNKRRGGSEEAMKRGTGTREIITVTANGLCLRGTYHRSQSGSEVTSGATGQRSQIGIVFPNSGVMPRAATGDSAVYWADSFAKCGYPAFRFDLEGLGDSEGTPPARVRSEEHTSELQSPT